MRGRGRRETLWTTRGAIGENDGPRGSCRQLPRAHLWGDLRHARKYACEKRRTAPVAGGPVAAAAQAPGAEGPRANCRARLCKRFRGRARADRPAMFIRTCL